MNNEQQQVSRIPTVFREEYTSEGGAFWADQDRDYDNEYKRQEEKSRWRVYWFATGTVMFLAFWMKWIDAHDSGMLDHKSQFVEYTFLFLAPLFITTYFIGVFIWNADWLTKGFEDRLIRRTSKKFERSETLTQSEHEENIRKMRAKRLYR